jgi:hypothetical protein
MERIASEYRAPIWVNGFESRSIKVAKCQSRITELNGYLPVEEMTDDELLQLITLGHRKLGLDKALPPPKTTKFIEAIHAMHANPRDRKEEGVKKWLEWVLRR